MGRVRYQRQGRLETVINSIVAALSISLLVASFIITIQSMQAYRDSSAMKRSTSGIERVLAGCMDFMFVRGRMNVVLVAAAPVSNADAAFMATRLAKATDAINAGLELLGRDTPDIADALRTRYGSMLALKVKADTEALKPLDRRDADFRPVWFARASSFVQETCDTLSRLSLDRKRSSAAFVYERLLVMTVIFRDYYGSEASAVTALLKSGREPTFDEMESVMRHVGRQDEAFRAMRVYVDSLGSPVLPAAFAMVDRLCNGEYRMALNGVRNALAAGTTPPYDAVRLSELSVKALDSISMLREAVFAEAMSYADAREKNAAFGFSGGFLLFVWSICAVIAAPAILRDRVFKPIEEVMRRLNDACQSCIETGSGTDARTDELVVLARAADVLISANLAEHRLNAEIRKIADYDGLTGLLNRRAFTERGARIVASLSERGKTCAVAMADIDFFKAVNDTHGHAAGDEALRKLAAVIGSALRSSDRACRYGGEEFALLLPEAGADTAREIAERLRKSVEAMSFVHQDREISFTISIGVHSSVGLDLETGLLRADEALYEAKRSGRNRVVTWAEGMKTVAHVV